MFTGWSEIKHISTKALVTCPHLNQTDPVSGLCTALHTKLAHLGAKELFCDRHIL